MAFAMAPKTRTYLYGVATAAIPILVILGAIDDGTATTWLNLAAAILGLGSAGVATVHRPTKTTPED